jgi:hypothetical protein
MRREDEPAVDTCWCDFPPFDILCPIQRKNFDGEELNRSSESDRSNALPSALFDRGSVGLNSLNGEENWFEAGSVMPEAAEAYNYAVMLAVYLCIRIHQNISRSFVRYFAPSFSTNQSFQGWTAVFGNRRALLPRNSHEKAQNGDRVACRASSLNAYFVRVVCF